MEEVERLRAENEALRQHQKVQLPDLEALRDRTIRTLKLNSHSKTSGRLGAKAALNEYIKRLQLLLYSP